MRSITNIFCVILVIIYSVFFVDILCTLSWGQCPEEPLDAGFCDTLYVEPYTYNAFNSYPTDVEFAIRITHDVPNPVTDSIADFIIPLYFTSSNPAANATIDPDKNKCGSQDLFRVLHNLLYDLNFSIFQDLPSMEDPQEHNWMMDMSDLEGGQEWDTRILVLDYQPQIFWLALLSTAARDQMFCEGNRELLATMTITIDDTTTICIDSCFWPPTGRLQFCDKFGTSVFVPRHNLPVCFTISFATVGDANSDGVIDNGDVVYLINYLYKSGPSPVPLQVGDCNCDEIVDIGDVVFLINYLFRDGDPPDC